MRDNNEFFQEYVDLVLNYNYQDALERLEIKHQIQIPLEVKEWYYEFDKERRIFISNYVFLYFSI